MIKSLGINDFRSLCDVKIELKPLTILLGKNSSGKSSFLRLFPLLKQSCMPRVRGTVSLFGDSVDFGTFDDVIRRGCGRDCFTVSFSGTFSYRRRSTEQWEQELLHDGERLNYKLSLDIKNNTEKDYLYIQNYDLTFNKHKVEFSINIETHTFEKFFLDGKEMSFLYENTRAYYSTRGTLFPEMVIEENEHLFNVNAGIYFISKLIKEIVYDEPEDEELDFLFDVRHFVQLLPHSSPEAILEFLKKYNENELSVDTDSSNKLYAALTEDRDMLIKVYDRVLFEYFAMIYNFLDIHLTSNFGDVYYSKPVRTNAERYYRSQPLVVDAVEPDGSNLIQFVSAFSANDMQKFSSWMDENFGFHYTVEPVQGLSSIYVWVNGSKYNILDTGFGFTQILPIVTQLWALSNNISVGRARKSNEFIFAIEQPELHLHPALQCKFIDALTKNILLAKKKQVQVSFIIETHSETIINHIGRCIARQRLTNKDTSVVIFNKDDSNGISSAEKVSFDKDGVLLKWPIGFFGED